jgi:hypothetical protein
MFFPPGFRLLCPYPMPYALCSMPYAQPRTTVYQQQTLLSNPAGNLEIQGSFPFPSTAPGTPKLDISKDG